MVSPSTSSNTSNNKGDVNVRHKKLIEKAIRLARVELQVRMAVRQLLEEFDLQAALDEVGYTETPPPIFRAALRLPVGSRRRTITVMIDGKRIPLLLNPQGREAPEREQWLWDTVRARVRQAAA